MVQVKLISAIIPNLNLNITSNNDSINVLHWQCEANICLKNDKLVIDNTNFENQTLKFVELAKEHNVSIALTPEYAFSWEMINNIIVDSSLKPSHGKLWCFGMKYISLNDFDLWCKGHNVVNSDNVSTHLSDNEHSYVVIFDGLREEKTFVNLLAYLFVTDNNKLIVILQSKLEHMRDSLYDFEANGLSLGDKIFLFDGNGSSGRVFCSLICADALEKTYYDEITKYSSEKYVFLFNPQCNEKPYHETLLLRMDDNLDSNWRFLRLNWSHDSIIGSKTLDLGTEYIYKENDNIKDCWQKESFKECYVKNRSKGLNLLMNDSRRCQWTFDGQEHVALYNIKMPVFSSKISTVNHEFIANKIYIYEENSWIIRDLCPIKQFQEVLADCNLDYTFDLIDKLKCDNCKSPDKCSLILWDRFVSLCRGKAEHKVFLKNTNADENGNNLMINDSLTNFSNKMIKKLIKKEFDNINKIANYLENFTENSEKSDDDIKILNHIISGGICFDIDKNFPQNKSTMFNINHNIHRGLAIYTKDTIKADLTTQFENYSKNTDAEPLGVMLFYPDGDDAVQLFPNPKWKNYTETGLKGMRPPSFSNIGIGGEMNDA